jgi:protein-tyrosine-phosphatase
MFEDPKGGASVNLNAVYREVRDTLAQIVEAVKESA